MFGRFRLPSGVNPGAAALVCGISGLLLGGPAGAEVVPAQRAAPSQPASAPLLTDEQRLGAIGYRLATASADRCARPEMLTGLILHDVGGYDAETRPRVARAYGLTAGFGVLRLVPGSSGERAGLRPKDEIVGVNGSDATAFAPDLIARTASPDRTERFADLLSAALAKGPATLTVRRGGETVAVSLEGEKGCGGRFVAVPGEELNAWADGRYVAVTARMMRFAADDHELAFVVAHEMAHNILGHGDVHASKHGKAAEAEADALGVELLARAGFDLTAPARFLRRSARLQWFSLNLSHPGNSARIRIVGASIAKLERSRSAAAPVQPAVSTCLSTPGEGDVPACLIGGSDGSVVRAASQGIPSDDIGVSGLVRTAWSDEALRPHKAV